MAMTAAGFSGGEAEELRRAMGFKRSVERMGAIEARLRAGMAARGIVGEAQEDVVRGITSFALYGFPESHAASFALLAYASAYLKAHHPAAFLAGLLDSQPMGFYSAATLVKDAQRHGVEVRPIDVSCSCWDTTLEDGTAQRPAVRLPLRFVGGLREASARAIEAARAEAPFRDVADLAHRAGLRRDELDVLAECGALPGLGAGRRRAALWQVASLARAPGALFAGTSSSDEPSPLAEMTPLEETLADYRTTGMTTGPQLLSHLRPALARRGVLPAAALRAQPDGRPVRTAGHVIVRQRPESAKGFCFLTLEDETGTSNAILTPQIFRRFRAPLHGASIVEITGPVQNVDGVVHVKVRGLRALAGREGLPASHDYR